MKRTITQVLYMYTHLLELELLELTGKKENVKKKWIRYQVISSVYDYYNSIISNS